MNFLVGTLRRQSSSLDIRSRYHLHLPVVSHSGDIDLDYMLNTSEPVFVITEVQKVRIIMAKYVEMPLLPLT